MKRFQLGTISNWILKYSGVALGATLIYSFGSTSMAANYIMSDLGGGYDTAVYAVSFFGIGNASGIPLGLTYGGRLGRVNMVLMCVILYITMTFLLALAPNYPTFLVFRFIQGFSSGPLLILLPSLVGTMSTFETKKKFTTNYAFIFIFVSILTVCIGGILAYECHWRLIFVIEGMLPLTFATLLFKSLGNKEFEVDRNQFHVFGYISYLLSLWSFSLFVVMGQQLDWLTSYFMRWMVLIFVIAFPYFVLQTRHHPHPIINFSVLKSLRLAVSLVQVAVLFGLYYGMVFLLAQWLHLFVNYTPIWITTMLGAMLLAAITVFSFIFKLKVSNSPIVLVIGILFFLFSSYLTMHFNVEVNFGRVAFSRVMAGIGLAMFLPPLVYMILCECAAELGHHGLALFQMTRTFSCSIGISLFATIWERRKVFYHERLGGYLTPFSEKVAYFYDQTKNYFLSPDMSKGALNEALTKQSTALAVADCFYLMTIIYAILLIMLISFLFYEKRHLVVRRDDQPLPDKR